MLNLTRATFLIASAAIAFSANAARPAGDASDFGAPAANTAAARTITIKPTTKYVNVTDGETVTFVVDGKQFSWHFSSWPSAQQIALDKLAPKDTVASGVTVYVERSAQYYGI